MQKTKSAISNNTAARTACKQSMSMGNASTADNKKREGKALGLHNQLRKQYFKNDGAN